MKEPQKFSMSTGLPIDKDKEVKHYAMNKDGDAETAFFNFIQKAKESKQKYNLWLEQEQKEKETKDST